MIPLIIKLFEEDKPWASTFYSDGFDLHAPASTETQGEQMNYDRAPISEQITLVSLSM